MNEESIHEMRLKGLCFKCGDKWNKDHPKVCKANKAYISFIISNTTTNGGDKVVHEEEQLQ